MRIALPAVAFQFIVRRDVAWLLGPFSLLLIGLEDGGLHYFAAGRINRVGDIGMELGPAVGVASGPILVELMAALIAVAGPPKGFFGAPRGGGGGVWGWGWPRPPPSPLHSFLIPHDEQL